ncbi:uncharacterized protein FFB14_04800 [Fusarium fujikuroi]|nr:uncharacterized protein FFB14_04800 [Fusarium fujikuroi]
MIRHTIDNVKPDRDFTSYDLACDTAEQPSIQRARSHVVTAGPHLVKRDDHISRENLVVIAGPHFDKRDDRVPIPNWLPGPRDPATISAECLCLFTRPRNVVLSTKSVIKSLTTTYWRLRTLSTIVTKAKNYVVTRTSIITTVCTSTIPITEVDTVTVTGVDPGSVPDAVTSTVTVTDATIQTVLSTITATVSAITVTAEATTIWG